MAVMRDAIEAGKFEDFRADLRKASRHGAALTWRNSFKTLKVASVSSPTKISATKKTTSACCALLPLA